MKKKTIVIFMVVALMLLMAVPAFAQSTTTIDLDSTTITPELFRGANIIIGALAAVMFLIAGLAFDCVRDGKNTEPSILAW